MFKTWSVDNSYGLNCWRKGSRPKTTSRRNVWYLKGRSEICVKLLCSQCDIHDLYKRNLNLLMIYLYKVPHNKCSILDEPQVFKKITSMYVKTPGQPFYILKNLKYYQEEFQSKPCFFCIKIYCNHAPCWLRSY